MTGEPLVVSLPIADRPTAFRFYQQALGFEAVGALADDGVPEPLQFVVNAGVRLMLIPRGGFGWVIGDGEVAPVGLHEVQLVLTVGTETEVDAIIDRAVGAGAGLAVPPGRKPWGYTGSFTDPDGHLWMVRTD